MLWNYNDERSVATNDQLFLTVYSQINTMRKGSILNCEKQTYIFLYTPKDSYQTIY